MVEFKTSGLKDIFSLKLYSRVARLGSFSSAARECGLSQSQASRIIADLETELGVRLLSRSTRAVVPNEAGTEFLARIEAILAALEEAENSVRNVASLQGLLRISMPTSVGIRTVVPRLRGFMDEHPGLRIQLMLKDRRQDLIRDAVDVAIRLGRKGESTGTVEILATISRVLVASPAYVERHGLPKKPSDLTAHRLIQACVNYAWELERDGEAVIIDPQPILSTNQNEAAIAAAVAGLGIVSTDSWAVHRELENQSLVCILTDWKVCDSTLYAYFPMGRATRAAARAVVEYLKRSLDRSPGMSER